MSIGCIQHNIECWSPALRALSVIPGVTWVKRHIPYFKCESRLWITRLKNGPETNVLTDDLLNPTGTHLVLLPRHHPATPPPFPICMPPHTVSPSLSSLMTLAHSNPLPSCLLFTQALQCTSFLLYSKPSFGQRLFGVTVDSLHSVLSYWTERKQTEKWIGLPINEGFISAFSRSSARSFVPLCVFAYDCLASGLMYMPWQALKSVNFGVDSSHVLSTLYTRTLYESLLVETGSTDPDFRLRFWDAQMIWFSGTFFFLLFHTTE